MEVDRPRFADEPDDGDDGIVTVATTIARPQTGASADATLKLVVVEGPDAGASLDLGADGSAKCFVGTGPVCALRLTDPSVSRRHLSFEVEGSRLRVVDLDSKNGTALDGVDIREAWVRSGQALRLGSSLVRVERDGRGLPAELSTADAFGRLIGASTAMRRLYPLAARIARSRVPVIVEGETGTGKEVLAESLHELSGLAGPFVVFDCTTVAPSVLESELFGHERGAFTGAHGARPGIFEEANGGTLLLDEIGDLELPLQAKLLRVIDRGELRRVGGNSVVKVDVRVIAATRRDLDRAIGEGRFRDDLFHRLAVARLELPPLRERHGDIGLLARHFARAMGGADDSLPSHVIARFEAERWPGNVRELRNAVARYLALGESPSAETAEDPTGAPWLVTDADVSEPFAIARRRAIARFERAYVERLLEKHAGNIGAASRASGLADRYFRLLRARNQARG
jgi:DNA-binding NtrC family response regulator